VQSNDVEFPVSAVTQVATANGIPLARSRPANCEQQVLSAAPTASAQEGAANVIPLAVDIKGLSSMLQRSVASLHRDNSAHRLPAPVKIGSSVRWVVKHVELWLSWGCPNRREFAARLAAHTGSSRE
jgi:predicted DNA-binding transcriptional regulator AlpA